MAWPEGTPAWLKNQWGILAGQVSARASTAKVINSLRPYAAAAPGGWGPKGVIVVSQLRSIAAQMRNATEAVSHDAMTGTITAQHITEAPWSRSAIQQALVPKFAVRALVASANPEFLAGIEGVPEEVEQWVTHFPPTLPATLEDLVEKVIQKSGESGSPPAPVTAVKQMLIIRE